MSGNNCPYVCLRTHGQLAWKETLDGTLNTTSLYNGFIEQKADELLESGHNDFPEDERPGGYKRDVTRDDLVNLRDGKGEKVE